MGGTSRLIMLLTTPFPPFLHQPSLIFLRPITRCLSTSTTSRRLTLSSPYSHTQRRLLLPTTKSCSRQLHAQPLNAPSISPYKAASGASNHLWPEWSNLINKLFFSQEKLSPGADDQKVHPEDAFVVYELKELSEEFIRCASLCLAFSRAHPNLLGLLSRKDIEVIVSNGTPFLFKSALDTARKMRVYLGIEGSNVLESDKPNMVDIMKYILSYASNPSVSSEENNLYSRELIESSVRNLLSQMTELSFADPAIEVPASEQYQLHGGNEQTARPLRQNVEMKRGDWICPKCSFMNFARNFECLECEEPRPKKQLTGKEWQCPQCNFFNYGRNLVCLRCDCKRPRIAAANNVHSMSELGHMDIRLEESEEKAKRWFNKVSELENASDLSNVAVDEDFPEIMPPRKGENRFVVSTRKTPLERRQANSQRQNLLGNHGIAEGNASQSPGGNMALDSSIRKSLDQILGHSSPVSRMADQSIATEENLETNSSASLPLSTPMEYQQCQQSNSSYVPSTSLSRDVFSEQDQKLKSQVGKHVDISDIVSSGDSPQSDAVARKSGDDKIFSKPENQNDSQNKEQAEKSEKWFQRVAELHNVKDLPSAISDEDFPELMPMRKGENRFVVSKKKDRSLTSPAYKRQVAAEQAGNPQFVPFVPFPPGYFARNDTPTSDEINSSTKPLTETSSSSTIAKNSPQKLEEVGPKFSEENAVQETGSQVRTSGGWSPKVSGDQGAVLVGNSSQNPNTRSSEITTNKNLGSGYSSSSEITTNKNLGSGYSRGENTLHTTNLAGGSSQLSNQNARAGWTGKSLEGSAVKEPDPLDMSEEAKTERWFRRVAQIKDISELSQIPDEDFPSIMPMRKGVNRFVVSKRKTPLERRLTSPQYRRNLPTVSSDPVKKDNDTK
ncbi:zinc finger protein VAR3, chloroplastic [Coffea arabica]|uniref:Zinc finger protein VAR3, chloroplastic n=1 Tax=Coffea arabica TaxID=13443 RepID=A0A6P6SQJ3_COFAR